MVCILHSSWSSRVRLVSARVAQSDNVLPHCIMRSSSSSFLQWPWSQSSIDLSLPHKSLLILFSLSLSRSVDRRQSFLSARHCCRGEKKKRNRNQRVLSPSSEGRSTSFAGRTFQNHFDSCARGREKSAFLPCQKRQWGWRRQRGRRQRRR